LGPNLNRIWSFGLPVLAENDDELMANGGVSGAVVSGEVKRRGWDLGGVSRQGHWACGRGSGREARGRFHFQERRRRERLEVEEDTDGWARIDRERERKKKRLQGVFLPGLSAGPVGSGPAQLAAALFFFGSFSFSIFRPLFILGFGLNKALF
jgi:hypothetical protein